MKAQKSSTSVLNKIAKNALPLALVFTIQQQSAVEASRVRTTVSTEEHIQEISSMVQAALAESGENAEANTDLATLSTSEINAQIHSTIEEAIKSNSHQKANSKLGFLQKVVSLDCFFGGSDCLFKDKKSMMSGKVTEFAKKRFEGGDKNVSQYLAQVKTQVAEDLAHKTKGKAEAKAEVKTAVAAKNLVNNKQTQKETKLQSQLHESVQGLLKLNKSTDSVRPAPGSVVLAGGQNKATGAADKRSQLVQVPIDEVAAIGIKASPTYDLDDIQSVTLKAFRKVIGYDTFDAILKKDRAETKDPADYYNVTVSMMIKRNAKETKKYEPAQLEGKPLNKALDKGFPYDDSDIDVGEHAHQMIQAKTVKDIVGKLNGENVTKTALIGLITDKTTPVTTALAQISKSDADGLFKLMDANVTRGNLKNLITDKPAPITVALAQKSDADGLFKLMDANVTRGNLKNLITDKPAPITVALAQKSDADGLFKLMDANVTRGNLKNLITDKPAPITVALAQKSDADGLFKLMDANVTRGNLKNLITDKPAPITVALAQKSDADGLFKLMDANVTRGNLKNLITDKPAPITVALAQTGNPVVNPPFNNWSTNQPSAPHDWGMTGNEDLGQREIVIDGVNYDFVQQGSEIRLSNPVANPPFNNWSVNQPSVPHDHGLEGKADLGQNIIVDGHPIHFVQKSEPVKLAQIIPMDGKTNQPGNFAVAERDPDHSILNLAQTN